MFNLKDWSSVIRRCINGIIYPITSSHCIHHLHQQHRKHFSADNKLPLRQQVLQPNPPHVGPPLVVAALATFPAILSVTGPPPETSFNS